MPLKSFTYPLPETRFVHAGRTVYKLKMRYSHHIREDLGINREQVRQELEDAIRTVLGNLDSLQPFTTVHFTIFPYKNEWERLSELRFKQGDKVLISYPYVCTLYIELRSEQQQSYAAEGESPFTDCGLADNLTEEVVAAPVTEGPNEKKLERSQLQPNRKRNKSDLMKIINKENMANSGTMSEKKRKKRAKKSTQAQSPLTKQLNSWGSGKPENATHSWSGDGVKEQTTLHQKLNHDSPQAAVGGIFQFLISALFSLHTIFGMRRSQ
ncbi:membrane-anchored junction protein isoform X2 [Heterodontus francisci]|uniref:membrane-anchored junction protein isoform X2 n=1 Tax=Heterodontus francisci TaxID=7792 RepID=UPI00355B7166